MMWQLQDPKKLNLKIFITCITRSIRTGIKPKKTAFGINKVENADNKPYEVSINL